MTFSVDLTGLVLISSGVGLICGLIIGRIGNIWFLIGAIVTFLALIIWLQSTLAKDGGWYDVLNVISLAMTIWALLVMAGASIMARRVFRTKMMLDWGG